MCGILAVLGVHRNAESLKPRVLERVRRLRHRGPDWSGTHVCEHHLLAHERLAIVDPQSGGQPLHNRNKTIHLAVNGEIYNHEELREKYCKNKEFLTKSDCEIIIHLYESGKSIPEICNFLNGIFAFVLVDEIKNIYYVARDHMGIIPLYHGRDEDGSHWVSSEMKGLFDICNEFDDFKPGFYYDSQLKKTIEWYIPLWHNETRLPTTPLDLSKLHLKLEQAVERQMMSDVPYGVLLSGGLDSSLIAAIAAKVCRNSARRDSAVSSSSGAHNWPRLHSFSIGLSDSPDLKAAKKVAEFIDTIHHEFVFTVEEGLDALTDVIYHLETYDVTTIRAATPMYLMSRKIKAMGVKMVLSGEGSDEMFGGYLYFHYAPNAREFQKETVNKLKMLYKFDCLRANKATAAWGVEARVPFLDREFLDYVMNEVRAEDKMCGHSANGRTEKWCLRQAFAGVTNGQSLLPEEVLWRQKEQFSDGVGYNWIDSLKAHANQKVTDDEMRAASYKFPYNTPKTKEAYYIRAIFEKHFPGESARRCVPGGDTIACSTPAAVEWCEAFKNCLDNSGRSVAGVHVKAYDDKQRKAASPRKSSTLGIESSEVKSIKSPKRQMDESAGMMKNGMTKKVKAQA